MRKITMISPSPGYAGGGKKTGQDFPGYNYPKRNWYLIYIDHKDIQALQADANLSDSHIAGLNIRGELDFA